jgi:hypothetical protein
VVFDPRFKLKFVDFVFSRAFPVTGKEKTARVEKLVCGLFSAYNNPHMQHLHNKYLMFVQ